MLKRNPRITLLIALLVGLTLAGSLTIVFVATKNRTPLSKRLNDACQSHGGIAQDVDGANTVICKDGTAVDY